MSVKDWKSTLDQNETNRLREARWWCRDGRSGTLPDRLINKMNKVISEFAELLAVTEEIAEVRDHEIKRLQKIEDKLSQEVDELKGVIERRPSNQEVEGLRVKIYDQDLEIRSLRNQLEIEKKDKPIPTPERIAEMLVSATVFSTAETVLARTTFLLMDNPEYRKLFLDRIKKAW